MVPVFGRQALFLLLVTPGLLLFVSACSPAKPPLRIYSMGEGAEAGRVVYSVLEASWKAQLGDAANPRVPQQRFLLLRLSVTNGGTTEVSIPAVTLIAPSGVEYPEVSDGTGVNDWFGVLRRLKANETVFGWVLFDVPRGDYQLRVSDDVFDPADAKLALIQVPLRFESKSELLDNPQTRR